MTDALRKALMLCETDIDGAIKRFCGNEELYLSLLECFIKDPTMDSLIDAIEKKDWKESFMFAHSLKGLAGNLGFVPLFHSLGELVLLLRANKILEAMTTFLTVKNSYYHVISAINDYQ